MMCEGRSKNEVLELAKDFARDIVRLNRFLNDKQEYVLSKQILRSGTSVGANLTEANKAVSKKEFYVKCGISHKEIEETLYWLDLLYSGGYITEKMYKELLAKGESIARLLGAIMKTTRGNLQRESEEKKMKK